MITIYKYPLVLDVLDQATVELPLEAELLHVELQNGSFQLWAMVDTAINRTENRTVMVKGTGHEIPEDKVLKHINSFMAHGGVLVFHIFEVL